MFEGMKREWRALEKGTAGRRFQERHARARKSRTGSPARIFRLVAGFLIAAIGIVLMPAPGPGWVVIILGLGMAASHVKAVARALDWAELRVRSAWRWTRSRWRGVHKASGADRRS